MMRRLLYLALAALTMAAACDKEEGNAGSDAGGGGGDVVMLPLEFEAPAPAYAPGALLSVWAAGPDEVWIAGGEAGSPAVLQLKGGKWVTHDPGTDQQMWWVHGFKGGPVYVVGDAGALAVFEGGAWTKVDLGLPGTVLYGIWGSSPDDVWAVGGPMKFPEDGVEPRGDVLLHFDGTSWSEVEVQALKDKPESALKNLFKVWGASKDRVFVVGDNGLTLHYDGTSWEKVENPASGVSLFTVSGRSEKDVYAVGGGTISMLIHWDGSEWREVTIPETAPPVLQGVWTAPGHAVYISGWDGFIARLDGTEWTEAEVFPPAAYHALAGDGEGLWAVGGDITSFSTDYTGIIAVAGRTVPAVGP